MLKHLSIPSHYILSLPIAQQPVPVIPNKKYAAGKHCDLYWQFGSSSATIYILRTKIVLYTYEKICPDGH